MVHYTIEYHAAFKKEQGGTSLVVQWVRLCAPNMGVWVQPLVGELDPTCMPQLRV